MDTTKSQPNWFSNSKGIDLVWREGFVAFSSRESAFSEIVEGLRNEDSDIIGIIGMGGIGKTKLAMEIGKKTKDEKLFDEVVMAVASQNPNIRNIQGVLADMLDLQFKKGTEAERARELCDRIKKETRILVILDDVWKKVDMKDIGIPYGLDHKGCKIIITTRCEQACDDMSCDQRVHLNVIDQVESWALFIQYARLDGKFHLHGMAKEIVAECGGLPLALLTVGSALRDKSSEDYEVAIQRLSKSNFVCIESADKEIYPCLKLSYDYLDEEETKKCFLLCSLFPEDSDIDLENLTRYAIGQCLFLNVHSVEDARKRVFQSIKKLEDACLLLPQVNYPTSLLEEANLTVPWEEVFGVKFHSVRIHDMVRDVALWIVREHYGSFVVPTAEDFLRPWRHRCENATGISIKHNSIYWKFPDQLECPQLTILLVKRPSFMVDICFQNMSNLQVLDISQISEYDIETRAPLPASLQHLHSLRTLHICDWRFRRLDNISILGSLKSLEILSFRNSSMEILPLEIGELTNLRVLDLIDCEFEQWIPRNLLPQLIQLEELYTYSQRMVFRGWGVEGSADLSELSLLPHLSVFTAWIAGVHSLPIGFFRFGKLQRYAINCCLMEYPIEISNCPRKLLLNDLDHHTVNVVQQLLPQVAYMALVGPMQGFENVFPDIDRGGFEKLSQLVIANSVDLECLVYTCRLPCPMSVFSNLVLLTLENMPRLTKICQGQPPLGFLGNLKWAVITNCAKLQNVLPPMLFHGPQLEAINISACDQVTNVFELQLQEFQLRENEVPFLPCSRKLHLSSLGKLTNIWKLPNQLEYMDVIDKELCAMLLEAIVRSLNSLVEVIIENCDEVKEVFELPKVDHHKYKLGQLSNLVHIKLRGLLQLKCIWKGPQENLCLHKLEFIEIHGCNRLTSLFTPTIAQNLPKLCFITIVECKSLERLILRDDNNSFRFPVSSIQHISFPELKKIKIRSCENLKAVLPISIVAQGLPKVEVISIENCPLLEYVFGDVQESCGVGCQIMMSNLRSLTLVRLPSLLRLSPVNCYFIIPSLHELTVDEWPQTCSDFKLYAPWFTFKKVPAEEQVMDTQLLRRHLVERLEVIPTCRLLESLITVRKVTLINCEVAKELIDLKVVVHQDRHPWFFQLTTLELAYLPALTHIWKGPLSNSATFCLLMSLEVTKCPSLRILFTPTIAINLVQLKKMRIESCHNLKLIIAIDDDVHWFGKEKDIDSVGGEPSCFAKLEDIEIHECLMLRSLFPLSVVGALPQLKSLRITNCFILDNIFVDDQGEENQTQNLKEIELPNLSSVHLAGLPNYVCLTPPSYRVICPLLQSLSLQANVYMGLYKLDVAVNDPPNMTLLHDCAHELVKFLCPQEVPLLDWKGEVKMIHVSEPQGYSRFNGIMPIRSPPHSISLMRYVYLESCNVEEVFDLVEEDVLLPLELLSLLRLPNLRQIWKGASHWINHIYLRHIYINDCISLTALFTFRAAQTLTALEHLELRNCKALETIIEDFEGWTISTSRISISFQNLAYLFIDGCDRLKSVFPISIARRLPKLETVHVQGSFQLEQIFCDDPWFDTFQLLNGYEEGPGDKNVIVIPQLSIMTLERLPRLTRICPPGYYFQCPLFAQLSHVECPLFDILLFCRQRKCTDSASPMFNYLQWMLETSGNRS